MKKKYSLNPLVTLNFKMQQITGTFGFYHDPVEHILFKSILFTCNCFGNSWNTSDSATYTCWLMYEKQLAFNTPALNRSAMPSKHSTESSSISDFKVVSQISWKVCREALQYYDHRNAIQNVQVTLSTSIENRSASNMSSQILSAPTVLSTTPPYKYSNKRRNITGDVSGIVIFLKEIHKNCSNVVYLLYSCVETHFLMA